MIEILKLKFDQDLCKNLWYELNPRVRCAFGNVFPHRLEATRSISTESESTGNDISIRWIWLQTLENNFFKIFVPANHSVIKFLPNICSSKIIQSSNFFKIFVPPKYYYNQISSKYMFLRIIQWPNVFQINFPPKSSNHQISTNSTFLQIIKSLKRIPKICSSKIIQSSNFFQIFDPPKSYQWPQTKPRGELWYSSCLNWHHWHRWDSDLKYKYEFKYKYKTQV